MVHLSKTKAVLNILNPPFTGESKMFLYLGSNLVSIVAIFSDIFALMTGLRELINIQLTKIAKSEMN